MRFLPWRSRGHAPRVAGERVLIVSASIGGGHDGVAGELTRRLAACDIEATTVDFLDLLPLRLGFVGRRLYEAALRFAPGSYEGVYRFWMVRKWAWRPMVVTTTLLSHRRLARRVRAADPAIVVSVYPLASLALGCMRDKRWLGVPVATYLTDFSAHPLWIHPGVDVHLGISQAALAAARERGAREAHLVQPLVRPQFAVVHDRSSHRASLGVTTDEKIVLLVSGSWGVGAIADAVQTIGAFEGFRLVCVCGRNERLRHQLEAQGIATVVGWTDQMAQLMSASDVLVENAGGLTCMEAMQAGLPIVTFDPIAGHGRHNAELMAAAGVVSYARTPDELRSALRSLTTKVVDTDQSTTSRQREADPAAHICATMRAWSPVTTLVREPVALRRCVALIGAGFAVYMCATSLFASAAAHGVGVDTTGGDARHPTIVGIRLRSEQLRDPAVRLALTDDHVTAVLDAANACAAGRIEGIALASTGEGGSHRLAFVAAREDISDASTDISRCTGVTPRWFVALRAPSAFDWILARDTPGRTILDPIVIAADDRLDRLSPHRLYLVDGTAVAPDVTADTIRRIATAEATHEITNFGTTP